MYNKYINKHIIEKKIKRSKEGLSSDIAGIFGIKSTGNSKIIAITSSHIVISKIYLPSFIQISYKLTDTCDVSHKP